MTQRLYYLDSRLREFDAHIVERKPVAREDHEIQQAVRLDRTAFYPTSGGQPYDTGTLDGKRVVDVWEDEGGDIWHGLLETFEDDTEVVVGSIDWARRFDHMQQHSGQHLLSAAFEAQLNARTVGFHLSSEESTLDLDVPDLDWDAVFRVEASVNWMVWADQVVNTQMVDPSELDADDLRKPPSIKGIVRVITMGPYDASACGGTHVTRTGEIGLVKIVNFANYKGGSRVTFLCGGRALRHYQEVLRLAAASSLQLSVGVSELPEAVDRVLDDLKSTRRELREIKMAWSALQADQLWSEADVVDGMRVIIHQWADRDFEDVRAMALQLRERSRTMALLAATGQGVRLICACSEDLPEVDAVDVLHRALEPLGGRGGGSQTLAQGGAAPHDPDIVLDAMRQSFSMGGT